MVAFWFSHSSLARVQMIRPLVIVLQSVPLISIFPLPSAFSSLFFLDLSSRLFRRLLYCKKKKPLPALTEPSTCPSLSPPDGDFAGSDGTQKSQLAAAIKPRIQRVLITPPLWIYDTRYPHHRPVNVYSILHSHQKMGWAFVVRNTINTISFSPEHITIRAITLTNTFPPPTLAFTSRFINLPPHWTDPYIIGLLLSFLRHLYSRV